MGVDLPRDVPLEAPDDLPLRPSLLRPPGHVVARSCIATQADHHHTPQGLVRLAVSDAVQPMSSRLAGGSWDGGDAAQMRKRSFRDQPVRVVAGGDEESPCN